MLCNLNRNHGVRSLPEAGSQVKTTHIAVAVWNNPTPHSHLLRQGFREYKNTLPLGSQEVEEYIYDNSYLISMEISPELRQHSGHFRLFYSERSSTWDQFLFGSSNVSKLADWWQTNLYPFQSSLTTCRKDVQCIFKPLVILLKGSLDKWFTNLFSWIQLNSNYKWTILSTNSAKQFGKLW